MADYTSIPVPDVLDLFNDPAHEGGPMLIMSRVRGTPLSRTRQSLDSLSPDQLTTIADTLREWLNELQYLHSPFGRSVCGYLGNVFMSYRIDAKNFVGPYRTQDMFHEEECCAMTDRHDPKVRSLAAIIRQKRYDISFAHGNVSPENVLVDRNYRPVGLVGWECAGWMPSYWELTSGAWTRRNMSGAEIWCHILIRCLPQYTDELKVERELWRTYNPL
jgi:aminoglycoside phosphotransferase